MFRDVVENDTELNYSMENKYVIIHPIRNGLFMAYYHLNRVKLSFFL